MDIPEEKCFVGRQGIDDQIPMLSNRAIGAKRSQKGIEIIVPLFAGKRIQPAFNKVFLTFGENDG